MTAMEKLLERVMTLSEAEADEALRLLNARRDEAKDEWGSLSKVHEVTFGDSMRRLGGVRARGRPHALVRRGGVFWAEHPEWGRRPAVVMIRDAAIGALNRTQEVGGSNPPSSIDSKSLQLPG